jgi:hypothetical protein
VGHNGEFHGKLPPSNENFPILVPVVARASAPSNREGKEEFRK